MPDSASFLLPSANTSGCEESLYLLVHFGDSLTFVGF